MELGKVLLLTLILSLIDNQRGPHIDPWNPWLELRLSFKSLLWTNFFKSCLGPCPIFRQSLEQMMTRKS